MSQVIEKINPQPLKQQYPIEELTACGWRYEEVVLPDGSIESIMRPLTEEEYLHPQEGDHMPTSAFHAKTIQCAYDLFARRYSDDPTVCVFTDLLIRWDIPELGDHSPDITVIFNVTRQDEGRERFDVALEGARPSLIIEVVSGRYRTTDRETKVEHYERARVQEYIILDRRQRRGQITYETLGYRLARGRYVPITPDDQDRILCRTVGLYLSLRDGELIMEDAATGERLLTSKELARLAATERQHAEAERQRADEERQRADAAEAETARLRAELARLRHS
jgi:Uma2 family endonuclease